MLLAGLMHTPHDKLNYSPSGKWSVSQILTHLVTSERMSLIYMKKKSQDIDQVDNSILIESFKLLALKMSQRLPLRYKAPRVLVEPMLLPAVIKKWNTVRMDLYTFPEAMHEENIRKKIYKHPIAGRLDVLQADGVLP